MKKTFLIAFLALTAPVIASGQINSTMTVELSNPALMSMEIDRASISVKLSSNYNPGPVALSNPVIITVKSNMSWTLTATSATDFMGVDNPANSIPCGQLEFRSRLSGSTEGIREQQEEFLGFLKGRSMVVARGDATPNDGLHLILEYRLMVNLKDPAGDFTLPLVFTLNPSQ